MSIPFRPLGIITEVIEQMELEVTYAYDDLVFISHNAFLLRMGDIGETVHLYFNNESETDKRSDIQKQLTELAAKQNLTILNGGTYDMKPRDDEQMDIHFYEIENQDH